MRKLLSLLLLLFSFLIGAMPALAKGPSGPLHLAVVSTGGHQRIDIPESAVADDFVAEAGPTFIDWQEIGKPTVSEGYDVLFYARYGEAYDFPALYVRYFPNPAGPHGYVVYNGSWHYATAKWDTFIAPYLPQQSPASTRAPGLLPYARPGETGLLAASVLLALLAGLVLWRRAWRRKQASAVSRARSDLNSL